MVEGIVTLELCPYNIMAQHISVGPQYLYSSGGDYSATATATASVAAISAIAAG